MRSRPPPEPFTFIVDECLGGKVVPSAIAGALEDGEQMRTVPGVFGSGALDETWMPTVGRSGWIVLSRDKRMRSRPNEISLIIAQRIVMLLLPEGTGEFTARVAAESLPNVRRVIRACKPAFVGRIHDGGDIDVLHDDGKKVHPPRRRAMPSRHRR